jgi:serine protease
MAAAAALCMALSGCNDLRAVTAAFGQHVRSGVEARLAQGPKPLASVDTAARTVSEELLDYARVRPAMFVPGEIIAKPKDAVIEAQAMGADGGGAPLRAMSIAPSADPERVAERALEALKLDGHVRDQVGKDIDGIADAASEPVIVINLDGMAAPIAFDETARASVSGAGAGPQRVLESETGGLSAAAPASAAQNAIPGAVQTAIPGAQPKRADAPEPLPPPPDAVALRPDGCPQGISTAELHKDIGLATECAVKQIAATGAFEYVEPNFVVHTEMEPNVVGAPVTDPSDPLWILQWHMRDQGAATGQSPGGASFRSYWSRHRNTGSRRVVVAVIDTGLDLSHPDFAGSPNIAQGFDMVRDIDRAADGNGRDADPNDPGDKCDPNDPNTESSFHGTHVAGTIGANSNNGVGVAGGAWNVTLVPVRAIGRCGGSLTDINDAIRWAAGTAAAVDSRGATVVNRNPAKIINMSLGLFTACPRSMQDAIDQATAAGAVIVVAAGNARTDTRSYAPASCKNVIVVAAGDARGVLAPYSNYGAEVDILAPGGDLKRDDDKDRRPDGVLSTKRKTKGCKDPMSGAAIPAGCLYSYEMGTSMAAPHVTAALALIRSENPEATPAQLSSILLSRAVSPIGGELMCSGDCAAYPNSRPIAGQPGVCYRPCGVGRLDLARLDPPQTVRR